MRRPTAPAAAINRAVRAKPAQTRALLDAAADLRRAHEGVMSGAGDRDALKAATGAERQAVNSLAATAASEAGGGRSASADVERRIRDTLEAVALDPEVRERFAAGRLEQDARAAGLPMDLSVPAARATSRKPRGGDAARKASERELRTRTEALRRAESAVERRRRDVEAAERARERANTAYREAREGLKAAESELRQARRDLERLGAP